MGFSCGIVGYGLMGSSLAARLVSRGHKVFIYNRSMPKYPVPDGTDVTRDINAVVRKCDEIVLIVSDYPAINDVLDHCETLKGKHLFQMTTIAPEQTKRVAERVADLSGCFIECPVLGSRPEAMEGRLLGMVGPKENVDDSSDRFLGEITSDRVTFEKLGQASSVKLSLNFLILSLTASFSTALSYIQTQNIDVEAFMAILRQSALYTKTFDKKLAAMLGDNFENPNFPTRHLRKDAALFMYEQSAAGLDTGLSQSLLNIVEAAVQTGNAELDYASLFRVIKKRNG